MVDQLVCEVACRFECREPDEVVRRRRVDVLSEPALIPHVRGRVDRYSIRAIVEQGLGEIDALAQTLPNTDDQDAVIIDHYRP